MTASRLDMSRIREETWLAHIEFHRELPSTNDHALTLARDAGLPRPALIVAEHQTRGRGRGGNAWQAGPGALTFSLILDRPDGLPRERLSLVSLAAGLAVRTAIARLASQSRVQVKWPNDVYLAGKKVAGILTETASAAPERVVVGIGVNVNNSLADAPPEIRQRGISLADHLGAGVDSTELLIALLIELESEIARLAADGELDEARWQSHCLLRERQVSVRAGSTIHAGHCRGVGTDGGLRIEQAEETRTLYAGEVIAWKEFSPG